MKKPRDLERLSVLGWRLIDLKWRDKLLKKRTCSDNREELNRNKSIEKDLRGRLKRKLSNFFRDSKLLRKKRLKD